MNNILRNECAPLVSVCVVTYNQENYIRECLQSIIDQKCNFEFEIIVGDDASTDRTREIVREIASKHKFIRPIFHEKNIGIVKNYISVHENALGKYVAHIDGDDRCLNEKLAKQASFLNENSDCSAVFHKLEMQDIDGVFLERTWPINFTSSKYSLNDVALGHPIFGHSSMMYRNGMLDSLFRRNFESFIDYQVYLALAAQGKLGVLDESLGLYTVGAGISSSNNLYQQAIQALVYAREFGLSEIDYRKSTSRQYLIFAKKAIIENDIELFSELIEKSVSEKIISPIQVFLYLLRWHPKIIINSANKLRSIKEKL